MDRSGARGGEGHTQVQRLVNTSQNGGRWGVGKVSSDCHTSSGCVGQPQGTQRQVPTRNTRAGASKGGARVCVYVRISSHTDVGLKPSTIEIEGSVCLLGFGVR